MGDDSSRVTRVETSVLDQVAESVVRELWASRIKTFVPVLALRQAREMLRDQDLATCEPRPEKRHTGESMPLPAHDERRGTDAYSIHDDVKMGDDRDVPWRQSGTS